MNVGYMMMLPNLHENLSDAEMLREEVRLAALAEEVGYDSVWCPEHHFDSYSIAPDNLQILTWVAARTRRVKLGSAAIILPWWPQPIRVAEQIATLDALSDGRFLVGFGRGLARREYAAFGISMEETRDRFDEAARMIVDALRTGFIEGEGPYFPQARTEIRPRPEQGIEDRLYTVAMSPESVEIAGQLGARMMCFVQFEMEKHRANIEHYRNEFAKSQGRPAPMPLLLDFCYCDSDPGRAEATVRKYLSTNYLSILEHYEFLEDYHKKIAGYEMYGESSNFLRSLGIEKAVEDYISHQAWGTPQQILDKLERRRQVVGAYEWNSIVSYAGMPYDQVERSMRLIGEEVLPELRSW